MDRARPASVVRRLARDLAGYGSVAVGGLGLFGDRPLRGPLIAQLSVADPCNHRCVMCPYHPPGKAQGQLLSQFGGRAPELMALSTYRRVIQDLARLGTRRVDLVGRGEPLLHPDLPTMVAEAVALGLEVSMTSNGSRLDEATASALADAGLSRLKVSLNAGRAATYPSIHTTESEDDFVAVLDGVRRLTTRPRAQRPHVTLSFTVSQLNREELDAMLRRVVETGADGLWLQHLIPVPERPDLSLDRTQLGGLLSEELPRLAAEVARLGLDANLSAFEAETRQLLAPDTALGAVPCYVGYYFTAVLGNGEVMPCCQTETSVGRVGERSFAEVWRGRDYQGFRGAARRLPEKGPELATAGCEECYFRPHNVAVHRATHPWQSGVDGLGVSARQVLKLLRLDA